MTVSGGSITTNGSIAHAVLAAAGGSIALSDGTTVLTTGDGSAGLFVNGVGASITATGITVTTTGAPATGGFPSSSALRAACVARLPDRGDAVAHRHRRVTGGLNAYGVFTNSDGQTTINGGSVTTSGTHAIGVLTQNSGSSSSLTGTSISTSGNGSPGVALEGTGSSLTLSGVNIATTGTIDPTTGVNAFGVYNGTNLDGSVVGGGTATITNSTIATGGVGAHGILTNNSGSTTVLGGSISTTGAAADAVALNTGGAISLNGTTIVTSGDTSTGLEVDGTGSNLQATGVTITTKDAISYATGLGVHSGGQATLSGGS